MMFFAFTVSYQNTTQLFLTKLGRTVKRSFFNTPFNLGLYLTKALAEEADSKKCLKTLIFGLFGFCVGYECFYQSEGCLVSLYSYSVWNISFLWCLMLVIVSVLCSDFILKR